MIDQILLLQLDLLFLNNFPILYNLGIVGSFLADGHFSHHLFKNLPIVLFFLFLIAPTFIFYSFIQFLS